MKTPLDQEHFGIIVSAVSFIGRIPHEISQSTAYEMVYISFNSEAALTEWIAMYGDDFPSIQVVKSIPLSVKKSFKIVPKSALKKKDYPLSHPTVKISNEKKIPLPHPELKEGSQWLNIVPNVGACIYKVTEVDVDKNIVYSSVSSIRCDKALSFKLFSELLKNGTIALYKKAKSYDDCVKEIK